MFLPSLNRWWDDFVIRCAVVSTLLGALVRIPYLLRSDFALGDGGLFVSAINAIRENHYGLPAFIDFNHVSTPFSYPPAGFYLGALLCDGLRISSLTYAHWAPLALNLAMIPLVVLLSSRFLKSKTSIFFCSVFFPLLLRSYEWLIMGGGITRSAAFFFHIAAIYFAHNLSNRFQWRDVVFCGLFVSAAVGTHMEFAVNTAVVVSLILLNHARKDTLWSLLLVGFGSLALTAPWWTTVIENHGLLPFQSAGQTSEWNPTVFSKSILAGALFWRPYGPLLGLFGFIGFAAFLFKKEWVPPLWFLTVFFLTPRHALTAGTVPMILLVAKGLDLFSEHGARFIRETFSELPFPNLTATVRGGSALLVVVSILVMTVQHQRIYPLLSLTKQELQSLDWIRQNTPPDATFLVISRPEHWQIDYYAEWFPERTGRRSLTTVQGTEWLPGGTFERRVREFEQLKWIQINKPRELPRHVERTYKNVDYVVIFPSDERPLRGRYFLRDKNFRIVHEDAGCLVLQRLSERRMS